MREHQSTWPLHDVGEWAVSLVREFLDLCSFVVLLRGSGAQVRWPRPSEGVFKVNFDTALFENIGCACIGVVIRD